MQWRGARTCGLGRASRYTGIPYSRPWRRAMALSVGLSAREDHAFRSTLSGWCANRQVHVTCETTVAHPAADAVPDATATSTAPISAPVATTERPALARRPSPNTLIAMSHLVSG